jgi:hypothetical protein
MCLLCNSVHLVLMVSVFQVHIDGAGCKHSEDVAVVKFCVVWLAVNRCMVTQCTLM